MPGIGRLSSSETLLRTSAHTITPKPGARGTSLPPEIQVKGAHVLFCALRRVQALPVNLGRSCNPQAPGHSHAAPAVLPAAAAAGRLWPPSIADMAGPNQEGLSVQ